MHVQASTRLADQIIFDLARRQNGVVARWQLLPLGNTREQIAVRLEAGRLAELHRGVYLVGAVPSEHALSQAALLAFREGAVLSHFSAARLWSLLDHPQTAHPWVTLPTARRSARPRIETRCADLKPVDVRRRHSMPLTSPPRTVLDCASVMEDPYGTGRQIRDDRNGMTRRLRGVLALRGDRLEPST